MASLWIAATGLAGCATDVPLGDQGLQESDVQARAAQVEARVTTRERAHELLGAPWLACKRYGVEVYRALDTQHQMLLVFAPYPVPLPAPGNKFEAYTLVSYAPDGRVAGIAARLGQAGMTAPNPINIRIRADDAEFVRASETTLAIPLTRFLEKLEPGAADACTVLVSCAAGQLCWNRVQVDRGSARKLPFKRQMLPPSPAEKAAVAADTTPPAAADPCGDIPMLPGVGPCVAPDELIHRRWIPLELPPGRHTLQFTSRFNTGEPTGEIECQAGQVVYATLSGTLLARLTATQQLQNGLRLYDAVAEVTFTSALPEEAAADSVFIYYDDDWLVNDANQPGR